MGIGWGRYLSRGKMDGRQRELFALHRSWAEGIGKQYASRRALPPEARHEVVNAALEGLWLAILRYDARKNAEFRAFAFTRVNGAIRDDARRNDLTSRYRRERGEARPRMQSLDVVRATIGKKDLTYRDILPDARAEPPGAEMEARDEVEKLLKRISGRSKRSGIQPREVIRLYYWKGLNMRQIAKRKGCSEGRICQIMQQALAEMRGEYEGRKRSKR